MDVHITEEYVAKRRKEKSLGKLGGSFRQRNEEGRGREIWTALKRGFEERKVEISSVGSEKAGNDALFGIFSA